MGQTKFTEPVEIFASGDNYNARGFVFPDGRVKILKGALICPYSANSTRGYIIDIRNRILKEKAKDNCLIEDVIFDDHSEAASVITGVMSNGNVVFKTVDGIPLGQYVQPETEANAENSEVYVEGAMKEVVSNQYERNREARKKCLEANGTACKICGFDFGKTYGPEFAGMIEVHHIVPISSIGKDYVVDPIHDLIPVCPNCHMLLHSKKGGGVYTPDEVRAMLERQKTKK
jgi:hypothetical protein